MECWSAGVLECWSAGVLECWSAGVLECWSAGVAPVASLVWRCGGIEDELIWKWLGAAQRATNTPNLMDSTKQNKLNNY